MTYHTLTVPRYQGLQLSEKAGLTSSINLAWRKISMGVGTSDLWEWKVGASSRLADIYVLTEEPTFP